MPPRITDGNKKLCSTQSIAELYANGGASKFKSDNINDKIRNLIVRDNLTISTADVSGGLFGYVGTGTRIINSKLYLSDGNQLIKAFNYAGGIVCENHGTIEQCEVGHEGQEQVDIDNQIIENERVAGDYTLFDTEKDEETLDYFIVAIGGIAGYSRNGVILDSYVKANVTKDQSFVSGGIIKKFLLNRRGCQVPVKVESGISILPENKNLRKLGLLPACLKEVHSGALPPTRYKAGDNMPDSL